ncbi:hypothetical protein CEXT_370351 [Caerostris extrusa]|uniref:Uncharacterized protein n=1 Tax=Caerostris extrusa TaxID=172846 RepID=A0AAV4NHD7_CAEEX|nr:hypothetical protein CEXT_370351 [Caerostris extrusa]
MGTLIQTFPRNASLLNLKREFNEYQRIVKQYLGTEMGKRFVRSALMEHAHQVRRLIRSSSQLSPSRQDRNLDHIPPPSLLLREVDYSNPLSTLTHFPLESSNSEKKHAMKMSSSLSVIVSYSKNVDQRDNPETIHNLMTDNG